MEKKDKKETFFNWLRDYPMESVPVYEDSEKNALINVDTKQAWNKKITVKKGNIGERIVKFMLEQNGWIIYKCVTKNTPHVIDMIGWKKGTKLFRFFEVKTKKILENHWGSSTGFNTKDLEIYKHILQTDNRDVFILFVDERLGMIYGNFVSKLIEPRIEGNTIFPHEFTSKRDGKSITVFPKSIMIDISALSKDQIAEIEKYSEKTNRKEANNK